MKMSTSKTVSSLLFMIIFRLISSSKYFKTNRPIGLQNIYQMFDNNTWDLTYSLNSSTLCLLIKFGGSFVTDCSKLRGIYNPLPRIKCLTFAV